MGKIEKKNYIVNHMAIFELEKKKAASLIGDAEKEEKDREVNVALFSKHYTDWNLGVKIILRCLRFLR